MRHRNVVRIMLSVVLSFAMSLGVRAETGEVKIATQYGIGYLALTIMKENKLIEKHLAQAGLADTKVAWVKLGAGAAANDALLSGSLDFASGGTGPAFILWDKTRSNVDVRGVAAVIDAWNALPVIAAIASGFAPQSRREPWKRTLQDHDAFFTRGARRAVERDDRRVNPGQRDRRRPRLDR